MAIRMQLLMWIEVGSNSGGSPRKRDKSYNKSRGHKDIECHHYGKKGHIKHDCYAWKREQKGKRQDSHKEEP